MAWLLRKQDRDRDDDGGGAGGRPPVRDDTGAAVGDPNDFARPPRIPARIAAALTRDT